MNTITITQGRSGPARHAVPGELRAALLVCGILSALLYAAMVAFVAMRWEGYNSASQTHQRAIRDRCTDKAAGSPIMRRRIPLAN